MGAPNPANNQGKNQLPQNIAQYLTFLTAGEEYAISIVKVSEIVEYETVTTVPGAPAWIRGVTNLQAVQKGQFSKMSQQAVFAVDPVHDARQFFHEL